MLLPNYHKLPNLNLIPYNNLTEISGNQANIVASQPSIKFKYDTNGNVIEETHFGNNGKVISEYKCKYDEQGRILDATYKDFTENLEYVYKTTYQSN